MTTSIAKARGAIGHKTAYRLGKGGFDPASPWPWNKDSQCDCTGFLAWWIGTSRKTNHPWYVQQNGGWLETTAIARDALTPYGMFDLVQWAESKPGCILVWGDTGASQGHVGIVSAIDDSGPTQAIHCSKGNWVTFGDAIQETGVDIWRRHNALVVRCALVELDTDA